MKSQEMLKSVLHTVQMGQAGIQCVQNQAVNPDLKREMQHQLEQYDAIETSVKRLAKENRWDIPDISQSLVAMSDVMSKMKLIGGERDSKIAGMLIQGNTRGMILGIKNLRKGTTADPKVRALAEKLITQEKVSIEKTERFL